MEKVQAQAQVRQVARVQMREKLAALVVPARCRAVGRLGGCSVMRPCAEGWCCGTICHHHPRAVEGAGPQAPSLRDDGPVRRRRWRPTRPPGPWRAPGTATC